MSSSSLHLTPSTIQDHLQVEDKRRDQAVTQGRIRAYARRNQMLAYGGDILTPGNLHRINKYLESVSLGENPSIADALLSAILTTGRPLKELAGMTSQGTSSERPKVPLLCKSGHWTWWLPAGKPSSRQNLYGELPADDEPALLPVPCSDRTRLLIERAHSTGATGSPIFGEDERDLIEAVRSARHAAGAKASLRSLESWLFHKIAAGPHGDLAVAAIITGRDPPIVQSVLHYTRIETSQTWSILTTALDGFDKFGGRPLLTAKQWLGSRFAPPKSDLREIIKRLKKALSIPPTCDATFAKFHNAMTIYTALFYLYATGCRPTAALIPSSSAIDPETGFTILDDKAAPDGFKTRLVWVSHECRAQLTNYEQHLERLAIQLPNVRSKIEKTKIPMILDNGQIKSLKPAGMRTELRALGWEYPLNAGRHYLRSRLVGEIGSEALHAFLGHWHLGIEPWSKEAALDPLSYRAELAGSLPKILREAGFAPVRGL